MITDYVSFSGKDIKISYEDLLLYKEGLIVIIPVLRSSLFQLILNKNDDLIDARMNKYINDFPELYFGIDYDLEVSFNYFRQFCRLHSLKE